MKDLHVKDDATPEMDPAPLKKVHSYAKESETTTVGSETREHKANLPDTS